MTTHIEHPGGALAHARKTESCFAIAALFLLTDLSPLYWQTFPPLGWNVYDLLRLVAYTVAGVLLIRRLAQSSRVAIRDVFLWAAVLTAMASALWSVDPEMTVRGAVKLGGACVVGLYLASRYTLEEQRSLVLRALAAAALASLLFALSFPEGAHQDLRQSQPVWKGIYHHKNHLGCLMVLSSLASSLVLLEGGRAHLRERWLAAASLAVSVYLVYRSTSKAALVVLVTLLAWILTYRVLRSLWNHRVSVRATLLFVVASSLAAVLLREPLLSFLERSPTLTYRTSLWEALLPVAEERAWFGHGYGAFWLNTEGRGDFADLYRSLGGMGQAHNGYVDLILGIGIVGTSLLLAGCFTAMRRSLRLLGPRGRRGLWPLAVLSFLLLYSFVESGVLLTFNTYTVLYVATVLSLKPLGDGP